MSKLVFIMVGVLTFSFSSWATGGSVCVYRVAIRNVVVPESFGTRTSTEYLTSRVATLARSFSSSNSCVDIQSLTSSSSARNVGNQTVGLFVNGQLPLDQQERLKAGVCEGAGSGCTAEIISRCELISNLSFSHDYLGPNGTSARRESNNVRITREMARLPRFSSACNDGSDPWQNAASTDESRRLLQSTGVTVSEVRALSLTVGSGAGTNFWSFGFPDHSRDGSPGTINTQAAEPIR